MLPNFSSGLIEFTERGIAGLGITGLGFISVFPPFWVFLEWLFLDLVVRADLPLGFRLFVQGSVFLLRAELFSFLYFNCLLVPMACFLV